MLTERRSSTGPSSFVDSFGAERDDLVKPKAFVTLNEGADVDGETLTAWLNPKVGKHERVQAVVVRDELPKTMIGKLDRKALRTEEGV